MKRLQLTAIILFIALLFLPLFQKLTGCLPSFDLAGVVNKAEYPQWSWSNWLNRKFQRRFNPWLAEHIGLQGWMVRTYNQLNLNFFGKIPPKKAGTQVVIGRKGVLFEKVYVDLYHHPKSASEKKLDAIVSHVKQLQDLLQQRGIAFVLLLAPSKAEIYPEYLPHGPIKTGSINRKSLHTQMLPLLNTIGVHYIDAQQLFKKWKKEGAPRLFSNGGTHWNYYGAGRVVHEIIKTLEAQTARNFANALVSGYQVDLEPHGADNDLGELLNIWATRKMAGPQIHPVFKREETGTLPDLLFIGDSFAFTLLDVMEKQHLYRRANLFYYFKRRYVFPGGANRPLKRAKMDLCSDIIGSDAVIIEISPYWLPRIGFGFIKPALKALTHKCPNTVRLDK